MSPEKMPVVVYDDTDQAPTTTAPATPDEAVLLVLKLLQSPKLKLAPVSNPSTVLTTLASELDGKAYEVWVREVPPPQIVGFYIGEQRVKFQAALTLNGVIPEQIFRDSRNKTEDDLPAIKRCCVCRGPNGNDPDYNGQEDSFETKEDDRACYSCVADGNYDFHRLTTAGQRAYKAYDNKPDYCGWCDGPDNVKLKYSGQPDTYACTGKYEGDYACHECLAKGDVEPTDLTIAEHDRWRVDMFAELHRSQRRCREGGGNCEHDEPHVECNKHDWWHPESETCPHCFDFEQRETIAQRREDAPDE